MNVIMRFHAVEKGNYVRMLDALKDLDLGKEVRLKLALELCCCDAFDSQQGAILFRVSLVLYSWQ